MIRHLAGVGAVLCAALGAFPAHAGGYPIDIEFLRPSFGHGSFAGVEVATTHEPLTMRYGTVLQYQLDPLTLYDAGDDMELGSVVTNRASALFGASLDLSERVSVNLLVPTAANWGSEQAAFAADGVGLGDVGAGTRVVLLRTRRDRLTAGVRGGLILPTGRPDAYLGEATVRASGGLLASLGVGPVTLATDAGVLIRTTFVTDEDFAVGDELVWGHAARVALPAATRTAFTGQLLTRAGLQNFLQGGAENALELIGGAEFLPSREVTLSLGAGRGLTEGYGTTDFRVLGGLVVELAPRTRPAEVVAPPPPVRVTREAPDLPDLRELDDDPPELAPEDVVVHGTQILIGDRIEFVVDTNVLQPYSHPVLDRVAALLHDNAAIGHVVIEGHASEEGTHEHNYRLASSRAERIWEELLTRGVPRARLSHTGIGEVAPRAEGAEESELQQNRRVEFHIKQRFAAAEDVPDYPQTQDLPWSGEPVDVVQPVWVDDPVDAGPVEVPSDLEAPDLDALDLE